MKEFCIYTNKRNTQFNKLFAGFARLRPKRAHYEIISGVTRHIRFFILSRKLTEILGFYKRV